MNQSKNIFTKLCMILLIAASIGGLISCGSSDKILREETKLNTTPTKEDMIKEIIRYAALAPSGHNTQPWKFFIDDNSITVKPDYSRKLPAVDPDDRELFISLGCALENLLTASAHFGFNAETEFNLENEYDENIIVHLTEGNSAGSQLFDQIEKRQCTRNKYDGRKVPEEDLRLIQQSLVNEYAGIKFIKDSTGINEVIKLVKAGNIEQFADQNFLDELKFWIRFSNSEAEEKLDGLTSGTSGSPSVPRWFGKIYFDLFYSVNKQNEKDEEFIKSSSGVVLVFSHQNDKRSWIETGRVYERFSLLTTKLNIKSAFINQPVEVKELNSSLIKFFKTAGYPQLMLRFGYADEMPFSPRRNLNEVLIKGKE